MLEFFNNYQLLIIILMAIVLVSGFIIMAFQYVRTHGLDGIRKDVYQLFLKAEHIWTESGQGEKRMKWVVQRARGLLPSWLRFTVSEAILKRIIQFWFDGIKDLLDDGKLNNSCKNPEG
jgi:hypothetical protein